MWTSVFFMETMYQNKDSNAAASLKSPPQVRWQLTKATTLKPSEQAAGQVQNIVSGSSASQGLYLQQLFAASITLGRGLRNL